ncbi:MAG: peptidyl-prolyl cis-trans isomerase [Anaerolineaceae bacterium]|nr:peptidyl-prolyl cis-trans isomerase [Anaerolineaceae bacterium]
MVVFQCGCDANRGPAKVPGQAKSEPAPPAEQGNPVVVMETSEGAIRIELNADKAPISVKNFLQYVDEKFYDGTIFHRVIDGFMIQGGGFTPDMRKKPTHAPIKNEAANGLANDRGTIAMARTNVVDSATAQFYINVADNRALNHSPQSYGYAVFGRVIDGLEVVDRIRTVRTGTSAGMKNVPLTPVVIKTVRRAEK